MKQRPRYILEYIALRGVAALARALPYRAALLLGWLIAWPAFHIFRFRVKAAKSRIKQIFGDRFTEREIAQIAWQSLRNVVFDGIEMMLMPKMTLEWIKSVADCEPCMTILKKHSDTGQGGITACPHMGSWELAGVASHLYGIPIFTLAARQKNPLTDGYINYLRRSPGIETIARGSGTMREILRKLKAGKMLAILPDIRMRTEGIHVNFLGADANIGKGMAMFARHADVPILPCIVRRHGWARHEFQILEPVRPDKNLSKEDDIHRMTVIVMKGIEDAIRAEPGQWFWFNKRWILDPIY